MLQIDLDRLPTSDELPDSDDTPVDNVGVSPSRSEDQNLLPNVLLFLLNSIWADRIDWFFGVDMGIYHTTGANPRVPVVPDAFLSLGVERKKGGKSRRSYIVWDEQDIVPMFVLEMVSHQPGGEYDDKLAIYANLGVLYYVIYNPEFWQRDLHQPLEVYRLVDGVYQLQIGEPYWMPEIGLGIGRCQTVFGNLQQEQLGWFNALGVRYPMLNELADQQRQRADAAQSQLDSERQRADAAQARVDELLAQLRSIQENQ
jgi:Uma2 family endonuclease